MSWAWVEVAFYGERITVRCLECGTVQPYTLIREAQQACRAHNRAFHDRDRIGGGRHKTAAE